MTNLEIKILSYVQNDSTFLQSIQPIETIPSTHSIIQPYSIQWQLKSDQVDEKETYLFKIAEDLDRWLHRQTAINGNVVMFTWKVETVLESQQTITYALKSNFVFELGVPDEVIKETEPKPEPEPEQPADTTVPPFKKATRTLGYDYKLAYDALLLRLKQNYYKLCHFEVLTTLVPYELSQTKPGLQTTTTYTSWKSLVRYVKRHTHQNVFTEITAICTHEFDMEHTMFPLVLNQVDKQKKWYQRYNDKIQVESAIKTILSKFHKPT